MPFGNPTKTMRRLRSLLGLSPEGTGRSLKRGTHDPGGCLILQALFAEENIYRPVYSGTGVFTQEASAGGLHVIDLEGDPGFWGPDPAGHQGGSPMSRTILNRC